MVLYKSEELCSPAQKDGFEPSRRYQRPTPFPGEPLQPLGYFCSVESLKYIIFQQASLTFVCSGEGGIRTHAPLRTNGFQDRLVMTTSISLQSVLSNVLLYSIRSFLFCQALFAGFSPVFLNGLFRSPNAFFLKGTRRSPDPPEW